MEMQMEVMIHLGGDVDEIDIVPDYSYSIHLTQSTTNIGDTLSIGGYSGGLGGDKYAGGGGASYFASGGNAGKSSTGLAGKAGYFGSGRWRRESKRQRRPEMADLHIFVFI